MAKDNKNWTEVIVDNIPDADKINQDTVKKDKALKDKGLKILKETASQTIPNELFGEWLRCQPGEKRVNVYDDKDCDVVIVYIWSDVLKAYNVPFCTGKLKEDSKADISILLELIVDRAKHIITETGKNVVVVFDPFNCTLTSFSLLFGNDKVFALGAIYGKSIGVKIDVSSRDAKGFQKITLSM